MWWKIKEFIINLPYKIKYLFQKIFKEYSDDETWSLYDGIIGYTIPRLERLIELNIGYPVDFEEPEEWDIVLHKILNAFYLIRDDNECLFTFMPLIHIETGEEFNYDILDFDDFNKYTSKNKELLHVANKEMQEGCELFGKYLMNLWW